MGHGVGLPEIKAPLELGYNLPGFQKGQTMPALTAADAIAPAIQRTRIFLFSPFRWGTFLKLSLVAIVTEGISNFRSSQGGSHNPGGAASSPFAFTPFSIAAIVAMVVLTLLLSCWIFYLITRLRFAFFHCLVNNTSEIRPGWRLYRPQAVRFFWLNLAVGFCFFLVVAAMALPFATGLWRLFREIQSGAQPGIASFLTYIVPLIPIAILAIFAAILIDVILRDWMLPHYALENATAGQAWAALWDNISREKGQFFAYTLLRLILPILALIAVAIVLIVPALVLAGAVAGVEFGIHAAFADATGAAHAAAIFLQAFFGVVAFGFGVLFSICLGGLVSTAIRQYALVFYGGRYRMLGEIVPAASRTGIA